MGFWETASVEFLFCMSDRFRRRAFNNDKMFHVPFVLRSVLLAAGGGKIALNLLFFYSEPISEKNEEFRFEKGNDYGMIYCAAPVVTEQDIKIFYAAMPELHYFKYEQIPDYIKALMEDENPGAAKEQFITRSTTLNCFIILCFNICYNFTIFVKL